MAAEFFKLAALEISSDEGEKLGKAISNVTRHYNLPGVSPEARDWIALIQVCAIIYGARYMSMRLDARMAAAKDVSPKPEAKPEPPPPPGTQRPPTGQGEHEIPGLGKFKIAK